MICANVQCQWFNLNDPFYTIVYWGTKCIYNYYQPSRALCNIFLASMPWAKGKIFVHTCVIIHQSMCFWKCYNFRKFSGHVKFNLSQHLGAMPPDPCFQILLSPQSQALVSPCFFLVIPLSQIHWIFFSVAAPDPKKRPFLRVGAVRLDILQYSFHSIKRTEPKYLIQNRINWHIWSYRI